jgi:hypothetical protein
VPDSAMPTPPGVRFVPLGGKVARGRVAWVDEWNYDRAMSCRWSVSERTRQNGTIAGPYAVAHVPGSGRPGWNVLLHNYLTGRKQLDHCNRDGLDCRESNLRDATQSQNTANNGKARGDHWSSRYKGVNWFKPQGRWRARVLHQGTEHSRYFPGTPEGEIAAARAYDDLAWELFGEFSWLNRDHFPELRDTA